MSFVRIWFLFILGCLHFGVFGQTASIRVLENVAASATIDQIAQRPASDFSAIDPKRFYALNSQSDVWMRIELTQVDTANPLVLRMRQPWLDRLSVFTPSTSGGWSVQNSGDSTPNALWPIPGLTPQLKLATSTAGQTLLYARVSHLYPIALDIQVLSQDDTRNESQSDLLFACLILGCMGLMAVLAMVLAWNYRDPAYAWYSVYAVVSWFALTTYCGIGSYALWPHSPIWAEISQLVLVEIAVAAHLVFTMYLFKRIFRSARLFSYALGASAVFVVLVFAASALLIARPDWIVAYVEPRLWVNMAIMMSSFNLLAVIVFYALRQQRRLALWWLLAYLPLAIGLTLAHMTHQGFMLISWLPFDAVLYLLLFEVCILMLILQKHAKDNFSAKVIRTTQDATDPLTGFVAAHAFKKCLSDIWNQSTETNTNVAIAYLEADDSDGHYGVGFGIDDESRRLRVVRMLRTVVRSQDTVAVINETTYAIVMPGVSDGEDLTERLSRLVVLGKMVDRSDPESVSIKLRIAASTRFSFVGTLSELDSKLRSLLADDACWRKKSIHFIYSKPVRGSDQQLESLWDRAVGASPASA